MATYCVVAWPSGHLGRAALGLTRQQHFHATLGFAPADVHDRPKDMSTLVDAFGGVGEAGEQRDEEVEAAQQEDQARRVLQAQGGVAARRARELLAAAQAAGEGGGTACCSYRAVMAGWSTPCMG